MLYKSMNTILLHLRMAVVDVTRWYDMEYNTKLMPRQTRSLYDKSLKTMIQLRFKTIDKYISGQFEKHIYPGIPSTCATLNFTYLARGP